MRVLFTSVGRRVVYLRQLRAAADRLGIDATFVGTEIDPLAAALQDVDIAIRAPRYTTEGYSDFLRSVCTSQSIDIVVPLTDPDARILATERESFEALGVSVAAVSPEMADVIDDKWRTTEYFASHGAPTPPTWLEVPDIDPSIPLLIKPRRGSAGVGIFRINSEFDDELPEDSMVQQLVRGAELTIDAFCSTDGRCVSLGMRERLEIRSGEVAKARTVWQQEIEDAVIRIVGGLGAVGAVTMQCFLTPDGPQFIEINGRVAGGIALSIHAGSKSDELVFGLRDGDMPSEMLRAEPNHFMTRFDDQYFSTGLPTPFEESTG